MKPTGPSQPPRCKIVLQAQTHHRLTGPCRECGEGQCKYPVGRRREDNPTQGHVESTPQRSNEELESLLTAANEKIARLERALAGEATEEMLQAGALAIIGLQELQGCSFADDAGAAYKAMRDAALKEST